MVASKGLDWRLPILPSFPTSVYLLGGYAGNLFLVERVGLEQPAAHSGVVAYGHSPLKSVRYKTDGVREKTNANEFNSMGGRWEEAIKHSAPR